MNEDIRALLYYVANGKTDALADLYKMLSSRIFNYARTITKNKEMAEDITHDVFLQINRQADHIAKMSEPCAYIMVIARNQSYNLIKRSNRAVSLSYDTLEIANNPPHDNLIFKEAFEELPANQRETVHLHLICGYSLKEIAGIQKTPLVTVKWRYGKALSKLRAYFKQEQEEKYNETY